MNLLGIDYGEKKIGLALTAGEFSRPFCVLRVSSIKGQVLQIKDICESEEVEQIVVGLSTLDLDAPINTKIKFFVGELQKVVNLPVVFQDETLSSQNALQKMIEAGKGMKKRREEDAFAAAIILQDYLDKLKVQN